MYKNLADGGAASFVQYRRKLFWELVFRFWELSLRDQFWTFESKLRRNVHFTPVCISSHISYMHVRTPTYTYKYLRTICSYSLSTKWFQKKGNNTTNEKPNNCKIKIKCNFKNGSDVMCWIHAIMKPRKRISCNSVQCSREKRVLCWP